MYTKPVFNVQVPLQITTDDIHSVTVGALEGGSNYWYEDVQVVDNDRKGTEYISEVVGCGGTLRLYIFDAKDLIQQYGLKEDESGVYALVDIQTILRGIVAYCAMGRLTVSGTFETCHNDACRLLNIDPSMPSGSVYTLEIDASDADCILQLGIFNEIVFG